MIMAMRKRHILLIGVVVFLLFGCESPKPEIAVDQGSTQPATEVTFKGDALKLLGSPISVGKPLPSVKLMDAMSMEEVDLSEMKGSVLLLSIVPSVDTPVCEVQTHYLGEEGDALPTGIERITISRDLPFAQSRFAKEAKLTDVQYLSDYKQGDFGQATGLMMDGLMLLARAVIVVDKEGVVQYMQVVPEITHLPDMDGAFEKAKELG
jgi:thiol peroxidase